LIFPLFSFSFQRYDIAGFLPKNSSGLAVDGLMLVIYLNAYAGTITT
jgi:hypothetical protein